MDNAERHTIRNIAAVLSFAILFNQFAYVAKAQNTADDDTQMTSQSAPQQLQPGPMSAEIAKAHTIFLSNAGADANFPIDEIQAYSQIRAALQTWGHYKLVASPSQADLIFQLRETAPLTQFDGYHGRVYTVANPTFQLTIIDAKTDTTLWVVTSPAAVAGNRKTLARWTSIAVTNLISRIKVLTGEPLSASETASLTTVPQTHHTRDGLIVIGAVLALGIGAGLIAHHEFENARADQKKSTDNFCETNHIPLSECLGG